MRRILGVVAGVLMILPAHAGDAKEWVCERARNNAEHTQCADREMRAYDAEMNRVYRLVLAQADSTPEPGYGAPPAEALKQSQRAWIAFRDANCHWRATDFYGGTEQAVIHASCIALTTRDRLEELKARLR